MNCPHCGKDNIDRAPFCANCGKKLTYVEKGEADNSASPCISSTSNDAVASAPAASPVTDAAGQQPAGTQPAAQPVTAQAYQAPQPSQQPEQVYQQPAAQAQATQTQAAQTTVPPVSATTPPPASRSEVVYSSGCMAAAWSDMRKSEGWVGKILLLGLINIVPILNWVVPGYAMRWSRKLALGDVSQMPKSIFEDRTFVNGAFYFVISLVIGLVSGIVAGILGIVPILGFLASMCVYLFCAMFQGLAVMRSALADSLGVAFDISNIWEVFKRKPGQLFCATLLPGIIVGAILCVILLIVCMIFVIPIVGDIAQLAQSSQYGYYPYSSGYDTYLILHLLGLMIPMILVCYVIGCFADALITVWTYRATGHFVARYASEWSALANISNYYR